MELHTGVCRWNCAQIWSMQNRKVRFAVNERKGGETVELAEEWLDTNGDSPFFLFVHLFDPHQSYTPPEPFASQHPDNPYAGEIAYADSCVGRILDKLESLELDDSTVVILTSDHGEGLGEHGEKTHAYFIYQSTMRVPLIIKMPGGVENKEENTLASVVDIVPTVLDLLEIPPSSRLQGESLVESLFGTGNSLADRSVYCESLYATKFGCSPLFGLLQNDWKYVWTRRPKLYDLAQDPQEAKADAGPGAESDQEHGR